MLQIIPINAKDDMIDDNVIQIGNHKKNSMAKKYNYAIENYVLQSNEDIICFRHDDTEILTPLDICEYKLKNLFKEKIGVAGVIGTIELENSCTWWHPGRNVNGSGKIIQCGINEQGQPIEYAMDDHPGVHKYLATVDGCILFFPKQVFVDGLRFDETLKGYHFYDTDICCQLLEKGYGVSTIDLLVKHKSLGKTPDNFDEYRKAFFEKWDKKINFWPISRLTKFGNK